MSLLNKLLEKKEKLKPCQTLITSLEGNKYVEKKNDQGKIEIRKLPETCSGFVVDEKLDLQIAEILDYLYLSSQDAAQDIDLLKKSRITHVLNIGIDIPNSNECEIKYRKINLLDEPSSNVSKVFATCFEFIESARTENPNNKVLVHCNAGYSRAPTVIIAYLMRTYGYSLNESFNVVNEKRKIKPNSGFMKQLKALEENLKV